MKNFPKEECLEKAALLSRQSPQWREDETFGVPTLCFHLGRYGELTGGCFRAVQLFACHRRLFGKQFTMMNAHYVPISDYRLSPLSDKLIG
jgi:hypothetical protein